MENDKNTVINIDTGETRDISEVPKEELGGNDFSDTLTELQDVMREMESVKMEISDLGIEIPSHLDRNERRRIKRKLKLLEKKKRLKESKLKNHNKTDKTFPFEFSHELENTIDKLPDTFYAGWKGKASITRRGD